MCRDKWVVFMKRIEMCNTVSNSCKADSWNRLNVKSKKVLRLVFIFVDRYTVTQYDESYVV
jgi:hypothetical protein